MFLKIKLLVRFLLKSMISFVFMNGNKQRSEDMHISKRTHRRNKAYQSLDQQFRQTLIPSKAESFKMDLRSSLEVKQTFRLSGLSDFSYNYSPSKRVPKPQQPLEQQVWIGKKSSALITSFNSLSEKLMGARTFLQNNCSSPQKQKIYEFINPQNALFSSQRSYDPKKRQKTEESTINLQSQKALEGKLKCKEKIVWANSVKQYYIGPIIRGTVGINDKAYEHLYLSHQLLSTLAMSPPKQFCPINLRCDPADRSKKMLVLDMDETLIHCSSGRVTSSEIEVELGDGEVGYVSIRPYALSFIKKMSKYFEMVVFTASEKDYADTILDQLDPQGLIKHRLYREHCLKIDRNLYTKDLRIINRDLSQIVMVDNSAVSFLCQPENGIPILSYYGGEDRELLQLERYLLLLVREEDVRKLNRSTFKLECYKEYAECQDLVVELYEKSQGYY